MPTDNQQFVTPTAGQGDWDASLSADLYVADRGFHITRQAGVAVNTGDVLWMTSGGYFVKFNPNSAAIFPSAMAYTAASSGDSLNALVWGAVGSIAPAATPGANLFVSTTTPGLIVKSDTLMDRCIGVGLPSQGILFHATMFNVNLFNSSNANIIKVQSATITGSGELVFGNGSSLIAPTVNSLMTLAGGQIKFPATQNPSSDANTLDDYEEGTFTPIVTFGGGSTGQTLSAQNGNYVKVGQMVFNRYYMQFTNKGSSTGTALVTGFPFASKSGSDFYSAGPPINWNNMNLSVAMTDGQLQGYFSPNATTFILLLVRPSGVATVNDTFFNNNTEFYSTLTYQAGA